MRSADGVGKNIVFRRSAQLVALQIVLTDPAPVGAVNA
jgi:hypothetical protein